MYENLGDTLAHECISASLARISHHVQAGQGRVVETIGDEVMATFESVDAAAAAAIAMQQHFCSQPVRDDYFVSIRIGFHFGQIEYDAGHPFGDTVNVAARVVALCESGKIVATHNTLERLTVGSRFSLRPYLRTRVKGKSKPLLLDEIVWDHEDSTSLINADSLNDTSQIAVPDKRSVIIWHLQDEIRLTAVSKPLIFGRAQTCDIVIDSHLASRSHGQIEFRDGEFVIVDHSTNGTYVHMNSGKRMSDGVTVRLHRRELPLQGKGTVSVGVSVELNKTHCVLEFEVE